MRPGCRSSARRTSRRTEPGPDRASALPKRRRRRRARTLDRNAATFARHAVTPALVISNTFPPRSRAKAPRIGAARPSLHGPRARFRLGENHAYEYCEQGPGDARPDGVARDRHHGPRHHDGGACRHGSRPDHHGAELDQGCRRRPARRRAAHQRHRGKRRDLRERAVRTLSRALAATTCSMAARETTISRLARATTCSTAVRARISSTATEALTP